MASTKTYVAIVNDAIQESGADLSTFDPAGSDFTSQIANSLMPKFQTWVSRAWKEIQQECYDWEFMEETGIVNIDPGIMFYTDGAPVSKFVPYFSWNTVDILDQDGSTAIPNLELGAMTDLTGLVTSSNPFGYMNVVASGSSPIQFALKPGAEYGDLATTALLYTLSFSGNQTGSGTVGGLTPTAGDTVGILSASVDPTTGVSTLIKDYGLICTYQSFVAFTSASIKTYNIQLKNDWLALDGVANQRFMIYSSNLSAAQAMQYVNGQAIPSSGYFYYFGNFTSFFGTFSMTSTPGNIVGRLYVHSWKSFDFNEELDQGDFQELIQEINPQSFRIIDYYAGAPSQELPLPFMAWEAFRNAYSQPAAYPGTPRLISEDNTGRWQLYPAPQQRYTIKFDYIRTPQILSAYNDIPKGLNDDFMDIIMWKAVIYYGEFAEQPSIVVRATKHYKDLLSRLEQKNREKFHFKPKRLW